MVARARSHPDASERKRCRERRSGGERQPPRTVVRAVFGAKIHLCGAARAGKLLTSTSAEPMLGSICRSMAHRVAQVWWLRKNYSVQSLGLILYNSSTAVESGHTLKYIDKILRIIASTSPDLDECYLSSHLQTTPNTICWVLLNMPVSKGRRG